MLGIILLLIAIGVLVPLIPMDGRIKNAVIIISIVFAVVLLFFGAPPTLWDWPRFR
jgi:hypothetical protein